MADILDDLDGPTQNQTKPAKFVPKNSRFKPRPKTEQPPSEPLPHIDSVPIVKKEELDTNPPPPPPQLAFDATSKSKSDDFVRMEIDGNSEAEEPNGDTMDVDVVEEEEDKVVREIDVYFTPQSDHNTRLYVLQYPLRPVWRPYELDERCEEVRVKPVSGEVEVDLTVDVDSKNYDPDACATMTKQILSCAWNPPRRSGYAVGVLLGNKLHLNPIHSVIHLRPSMQHFKSGEPKKRSNTTGKDEDNIKTNELIETKSVSPSKKQNKASAVINEKNQDARECWVPLKYHGARSDLSARYMQKMATQEGSAIPFLMSPYDYIKSLCPGTSSENTNSKGPSRRQLLSLPLEERYKIWLLEGPPVNRFDALKHLAPDDSVKDILSVLQKLALLVQGLWVPKSSLLSGEDTKLEILARDYCLLLFSKSPFISFEQLPTQAPLAKAMKDVLKVLAAERMSFSDWKFKEPRDISFIKLHPNIVKEQQEAWERMEKPIMDCVKPRKSVTKKTPKANLSARSVTLNEASTRTSKMSDETQEALPKVLKKVFQTHKVCSFQQICLRLREMAVSESSRPKGVAREMIAAANGVDTPYELLTIVEQIAFQIHGVYVLKSSPDDPKSDELRKVVIDLLRAEGPSAKLKKAAIFEAAKMELKREIQPNEYTKVMNELCVSQGSAWMLRSGDGNPR